MFKKTYGYPVHIAGCEEVTSDRISLALREKMMAALKKERTGYNRTDKLSHVSMLTRWWHRSYISGFFKHKVGRLSKQSKDKHRQFCFMNDPGFLLQVPCSKHLLHCKGDEYLDGGKDADSDDDGKISDDDGIIHPVKVA